ncbi:MAG: response regulator [Gemmatimonadota bacterium]
MRILIAEDEASSRFLLQRTLTQWGHQVVTAADGVAAWEALQQPDPPRLMVLDWMMPGLDGIEVCRRVRAAAGLRELYIIMITARDSEDDIVAGLNAGANDYLSKPLHRRELRARIDVGQRVLGLQAELAARVRELEAALDREQTLRGLLPICSYCKKVRDDHNYWQQVERYIEAHADVSFSHGICPDCYRTIVKPELEELEARFPTPRSDGPDRTPGT